MTRYSITRMPPSEHSEFSDVHGIDYMNITVYVPEHIMKQTDKLEVSIDNALVSMSIVAEIDEVYHSMFHQPISNDCDVFYPTGMYKHYSDESKAFRLSVYGYVCDEKLAPKLDGHTLKPDMTFEDDDGTVDEMRYNYPTNAKWVSRHGVELDKEVA